MPDPVPEPIDLMLCCIDDRAQQSCPWVGGAQPAPLVAIISRQSATSPSVIWDWTPQAVLVKPVEPAALLTSLFLARNNFRYEQRLHSKVTKLEETLKAIRKVERAKAILMKKRLLEEQGAYEYLRNQAMKKRVPIAVIASAVIEADEVLT
jgi:AmiR/NasT family two-component response regulator